MPVPRGSLTILFCLQVVKHPRTQTIREPASPLYQISSERAADLGGWTGPCLEQMCVRDTVCVFAGAGQGVDTGNNLGSGLLIEEPIKPGPPGSCSGPHQAERSTQWSSQGTPGAGITPRGKLRPRHGSDTLWGANLAGAHPLQSAQAAITAGGREGLGPVST